MPALAPLLLLALHADAAGVAPSEDAAVVDTATEVADTSEPATDEASEPATEGPIEGPPEPSEGGADESTPAPTTTATPDAPRKTVKIRPHRGMTIAGAVVTGVGLAGRLGIDVFLGAVAKLRPSEDYGTWSVGPFFMATAFTNVPTIVGLGLLGGGAYREGHEAGALRGLVPDARRRKLGLGLLGGGLGLWALSRAIFYPWVNACRSNACAYGLLETTYYASAGLVIAGLRLTLTQAGIARAKHERDADYIHITPFFSPTLRGLALTGRF